MENKKLRIVMKDWDVQEVKYFDGKEWTKRNFRISNNFKRYSPIKKIRKILGYLVIGYGIGTLWCPVSGSWFAIAAGAALLGIPLEKIVVPAKFHLTEAYNQFYANKHFKAIRKLNGWKKR